MPSSFARIKVSLFLSYTVIHKSGMEALSALAIDPPINPRPINPIFNVSMCVLFLLVDSCGKTAPCKAAERLQFFCQFAKLFKGQ